MKNTSQNVLYKLINLECSKILITQALCIFMEEC